MLEAYIPALVFLALGAALGTAFTLANGMLGPRRRGRVKREPYESGMPSTFRRGERFAVDFYLVGMLFLVFGIEVVLLYPVALLVEGSPFALGAMLVFVLFLVVAYVYEWARGSLDWGPRRAVERAPTDAADGSVSG